MTGSYREATILVVPNAPLEGPACRLQVSTCHPHCVADLETGVAARRFPANGHIVIVTERFAGKGVTSARAGKWRTVCRVSRSRRSREWPPVSTPRPRRLAARSWGVLAMGCELMLRSRKED